jgi:hypothetical protein
MPPHEVDAVVDADADDQRERREPHPAETVARQRQHTDRDHDAVRDGQQHEQANSETAEERRHDQDHAHRGGQGRSPAVAEDACVQLDRHLVIGEGHERAGLLA